MEENKTLYQMREELQGLVEELDNAEIDDEIRKNIIQDFFEGEGGAEKVADYCYVIKELMARNSELDAIIKARIAEIIEPLKKRIDVNKNNIERLKKGLYEYMSVLGEDKMKADIFKVRKNKTESIEVPDDKIKLFVAWCEANDVADRLVTYIAPKPNKKEIKSFLKTYGGKKIDGVEVRVKDGVVISC